MLSPVVHVVGGWSSSPFSLLSGAEGQRNGGTPCPSFSFLYELVAPWVSFLEQSHKAIAWWMDRLEDVKTPRSSCAVQVLGLLNGRALGSVYVVCGQGGAGSSEDSSPLSAHGGCLVAFALS